MVEGLLQQDRDGFDQVRNNAKQEHREVRAEERRSNAHERVGLILSHKAAVRGRQVIHLGEALIRWISLIESCSRVPEIWTLGAVKVAMPLRQTSAIERS
jgi:hypothetical protein